MIRGKKCSTAILISFFCSSLPVHSQVLEEIIVTAQKREQNIQDVGVSISAFTGARVRAMGWQSSEDIAAQTPGLIATSFSGDSTVSLFSIRGVGQNDFADHQEAPTAVYVDGAYVGFTGAAGIQLYDVERVEVLRGPQGTLFGRNATGGLIHIISKKPTREFEAYADLTIAEYNQLRFEGAISGPLTENLAARFSLLQDKADGYFDNALGDDARDRDFTSARLQLDYSPTSWLDANIALRATRSDTVAGAYDFHPAFEELDDMLTDFQGTPNNFPGVNDGALNPTGVNDQEAYGGTTTLVFKADDFTVTSITDFTDLEKYYLEDSNGNESRSLDYFTDQDSTQFSQEFRVNGETRNSRWVAGFYYLNLDGDYVSFLNAPTFGGAVTNSYSLETDSWSLFGQVEYDLSDTLTLVTGARFVKDNKDYSLLSQCSPATVIPVGEPWLPGFPPNDCSIFTSGDPTSPLAVEAGPISLQSNDEDITATVSLNYVPKENLLTYVKFSRGMKGGGFTNPLDGFLFLDELSYKPEILHSYEVGVKADLWEGRARVNASAFYYDYQDYQGFVFQGITTQVKNLDAEIYGGELEFFLSPAEGWEFAAGLSLMEATVEGVELAPGIFEDQNMITAPDVSVNFLGRYGWQLRNGGNVSAQIDGVYVDEQQYNTNNSPLTLGEDYTLWNARVGYEHPHGDNSWEVAMFVNNLTDEEYQTYRFDLSDFFGYALLVYGPPRWFGAEFRYNWN
ncbi:TonB-dependent receptor [Haliea sp. E1-2-M8]|uniref:TonB-dependent receptor n=1 Tax=Haliea sp. E1-2-M8 TaxID=3064706 RepID=UPI00271932FD|nr:TonB-dependent receptor [Haliea sp. E1-2-M8]MDO8863827.1 TonB-dependent receptor [Haliea sp. E1-2-M8]